MNPSTDADVMIEVGKRLRASREATGLEQSDFSAWGIERTRLSQWENGRRAANAIALIPFCERFGISLDWIFRGDPRALPNDLYNRIMEKMGADQGTRRGRPTKVAQ
ncbi:helix-turn-helix domain-containing protein [Thalassobaculum litoreum]|uniref:Transcriptional regulator, contains XRE-family HTH domain n=1 Tax=Thalassobaculum litoreum DSM 18839 TaxID=1123362 RepID=A0A8G2BHZ7_9PROT|nr:helix-turn-helix transcriptional regulator [Thalassobaculum litoreum]SDF82790.1 Transcriptional regulator, contains XRE-family HTH domain [Thalassobaculum litoreum DSM 18839]